MKLLQIAHKTAAILLLCLVTSVAEAQVTVEARIDSVNLFIGEQTDISLDVTFGATYYKKNEKKIKIKWENK